MDNAASGAAYIQAQLDRSRGFINVNTDSMEFYALRALEYAQRDSLIKHQSEAHNLLAGVAHRRGDLPRCLDEALIALSGFESIVDSVGQARMLTNIAIIYSTLQLYPESIDYATRGLALERVVGDSLHLANILTELARQYLLVGQSKRGLSLLQEARIIQSKVDVVFPDQELNIQFSRAFADLGQVDSSVYYADLALTALKPTSNEYGLMQGYLAMGYALMAQNPREALVLLEYAYEDAARLSDIHTALETQRLLKLVNKQVGDYMQALYHDSIQGVYNDTLFSLQKATTIADLSSQFDLERQRMQNELLLKEQASFEKEMSQQRAANNIMAFVLVLVMAGGLGLWFLFRRVKKLNTLMEAQREENLLTNERLKEMVEESSQQNEQIQEKNAKLEDLNAYKDKLFSLISHDFRSPLASVISLLQVLENGLMTPEESRTFAKQVGLRVQHTFQLVSNLLYWSKSQMKGINPNPQVFRIEETLREVKGVYYPIAEAKWVKLHIELEGDHQVYADPDMVQTVLRNLVSNAIKYTPNQGSVTVEIQPGVSGITVAVKDTGLGMDADTKNRLFNDHVTSRLGTQNEKGTGIGLALSKDFVDMNSGKIWVESLPEQGSTFFLYLPSPKTDDNSNTVEPQNEPMELVGM